MVPPHKMILCDPAIKYLVYSVERSLPAVVEITHRNIVPTNVAMPPFGRICMSMPTLPAELEPHRKAIAATLRPCVDVRVVPGLRPDPWSSRFGGTPYLQQGDEYPRNAAGVPLHLLAQINFAEAPALDGFPRHGLLQFFISDDDLYGLDFDHPLRQTGFRVRYCAAPRRRDLVKDFRFLQRSDSLPVNGCYAVSFARRLAPVTPSDFRFQRLLPDIANEDALVELYEETFPEIGHRLGGYPSFTQWDPREGDMEDFELLLQVDTDDDADIMWGDAGVGGFFVRPDDLAGLDFQQVLYNWDCG